MIIVQIFGWIFLSLLVIGFITYLYFNWKDMFESIKGFFLWIVYLAEKGSYIQNNRW